MFKFLKQKLSSWLKTSKKKIEKKQEEPIEPVEKPEPEKEITEKPKTPDKRTTPTIQELEALKQEEKLEPRTTPTIEQLEEQKQKKHSIFTKLKQKFSYKITKQDFNEIFEDLELLLLENNVALEAVESLKNKLSEELINKQIKKQELEQEIKTALKNSLNEIITEPDDIIDTIKQTKEPFKILFFGINGTGKTTTIAKLTHLLQKNNISCVLAAADTFRAASIEQLQYHADKLKVKLIKHDYNADPSAVAFDAIKYAQAHSIKAVLIDTAGRMHTHENLLNEMEKICRITQPDSKIFIAESIAGNDAVEQAKAFNQAVGIDGIILSKADVDEKGGTVISVSYATKKPIFYLGTGQNYSDLKPFNKKEFIEELGL